MPKKPPTTQQKYVLEYVQSQKEAATKDKDKSARDIHEIGCVRVRMGLKTVRIVEWCEKWKAVVVEVNGEVSRYSYPLHKSVYRPFVDFEVLEDCGYLEKFGNGFEYVIGGKRYGVKDDVVWAGGKRYLSTKERAEFGSFRDFLAKNPEHVKKRTII